MSGALISRVSSSASASKRRQDMQKPPESRRLASDPLVCADLDHHRRNDEDLRGKRDNARRRGFEQTHNYFPIYSSLFRSRTM